MYYYLNLCLRDVFLNDLIIYQIEQNTRSHTLGIECFIFNWQWNKGEGGIIEKITVFNSIPGSLNFQCLVKIVAECNYRM